MKERHLKLIMELIFIFIIPLILMACTSEIKRNYEYDNLGNFETSELELSFDNSIIKYTNDKQYINYLDFNQDFDYRSINTFNESGLDLINNNDGSITITGTSSAVVAFPISSDLIIGHKYYIQGATSVINIYDSNNPLYTTDTIAELVNGNYWGVRILSGYQINETIYFQVVDLTKMFGVGNEPTTVQEYKDIMVNQFYDYTESQIIQYESNSIISDNYRINYTLWGNIKSLIVDNLQLNDSILLDLIICYTILWFIMFIIWHMLYLFFDMLIHIGVDWGHREREKVSK